MIPERLQSPSPVLASPVTHGRVVRAILFDVDGTLYDQRQLRLLMALEMLWLPLRRPVQATRDLSVIAAYRQAQETLRGRALSEAPRDAQLRMAAERADVPLTRAEALVSEWMDERPQKHLRRCRFEGLVALLSWLRDRGVPLGVLSDYTAGEKLTALDVEEYFSFALSASDPTIVALKPHPRGFLRACALFNLAPEDVLYVGDRVDVDGVGAVTAGLDAVIVSRRQPRTRVPSGCRVVPSLVALHRLLEDAQCCRAVAEEGRP